MTNAITPRIAIIGVGLIGGSLGMSWRSRGAAAEVVGVTRREETIAEAINVGAIDRGTTDPIEGVRDADVVVVATPVGLIAPMVKTIAPALKPGCIVTDVGSTKSVVCREIWANVEGPYVFIGGHPMAGSEKAGVLAADMYLFQNAPYVLVPPPDCPGSPVETLVRLARAAGAHPMVMDCDEHDAIVATVSHLPHIVAAALVNAATARSARYDAMLQLAAGGFRDTTRVASGIEDVWTDICLTNVEQISAALDAFQFELSRFRRAIEQRDRDQLGDVLKQARQAREGLPAKSKGILGSVFDLVVHVVDRPNVIHEVTGIIGRANINIIDIEILKVREGEGGTLRLGFEKYESMVEAGRLLEQAGYRLRRQKP